LFQSIKLYKSSTHINNLNYWYTENLATVKFWQQIFYLFNEHDTWFHTNIAIPLKALTPRLWFYIEKRTQSNTLLHVQIISKDPEPKMKEETMIKVSTLKVSSFDFNNCPTHNLPKH